MDILLEEFKKKISDYVKYPFFISDHARLRAEERNISINKTINEIIQNTTLINIEKQDNNKYLLTYKLKHKPRYQYVVELKEKHIEIISLWKINNRIQKKINKRWKKN